MSIPIKIKRKADGSIDNITFCPTVTIEKQVWESTLHRSMVLQAENAQLKELLKVIRGYLVNGCDVEDEIRICEEIDEALK